MAIKNLGRVVGLSAYETWLAQGNDGTEEDFLATLKGEKGDTGETGPQGPQGEQGPEGRSTQADWSQNDETQADYIKNRICYEASTSHTILEKAERTSTTESGMGEMFPFTAEAQNIIMSSNFTYDYKLTIGDEILTGSANGTPVIGSGITSEKYGSVAIRPDGIIFTSPDEPFTETIEFIITTAGEVKTIDEKFIPDTIATKEYVDEVFNSIVNGDEVSY